MQGLNEGFPTAGDDFENPVQKRQAYTLASLSDAARTLRRMKDFDGVPKDIADHWRTIQHSLLEGQQLWAQSVHWRRPKADAVARMWTAFSWFRFVMPSESKLVLMVLSGVSWKGLARYRNQSISETQDDFDRAIELIAAGVTGELAAA
jgi:hypothetical protein